MKRISIIIFLCIICGFYIHAEENCVLRVISYNVENLFDCQHDSLKDDYDFLPEGNYHWNIGRYRQKLHNIAQVICAIGEWDAPAIIGLVEVENDSCLHDLCRYHLRKRNYPYQYLHYESPDTRGVDVALLFDTTRLSCIANKAITIPVLTGSRPTRDVLYAQLRLVERHDDSISNDIHCFVCHLPSQLGGSAATAYRRQQVLDILQQQVDSIQGLHPDANILIMGDFNMQASDNIKGMQNLMLPYAESQIGTHKYQGAWTCLDQFYVSNALRKRLIEPKLQTENNVEIKTTGNLAKIFAPEWLLEEDEKYLGIRVRRTYIGPRYHGGYSDHLPIYMDIQIK